jgi:hypothetical protein
MGQVLHGSATTTEAARRAIQYRQERVRSLAKRYGINPETVVKWKHRPSVEDLPTGPKQPRSSVLSEEEEALIVAFRRHGLLPLDDCLYALQPTIPHPAGPVPSCIVACGVTASSVCLGWKRPNRPGKNSNVIPLAISTSTLLKSIPRKAGFICFYRHGPNQQVRLRRIAEH